VKGPEKSSQRWEGRTELGDQDEEKERGNQHEGGGAFKNTPRRIEKCIREKKVRKQTAANKSMVGPGD